MATEDRHNDNNPASPPLSKHGAARRRLAKAGAGAAGVLWTLESKAGMSPLMCKSPSGALSGGLSSHYGPAPVCQGKSPGYWKNHGWPVGLDRVTLMFASVFYAPGDGTVCPPRVTAAMMPKKADGTQQEPPPVTSYQCALMDDLLTHQGFDTNNLGMHLVATWLNIKAGFITFLSEETLKNIWYEVATTGTYTPTAGVTWDREQVKNYLESTHD